MRTKIHRYVPRPVKKVLKPLYFKILPPPTPFIVLTRGRTGSNLLLSFFGNHPEIRMQNEIFGQYLMETAAYTTAINEHGAPSFLRDFYKRRDRELAVGAKILYYQIEAEYADRFNVPSLVDVPAYLQKVYRLKIVHLKRRNYLKTIVSWKLAHQTNQWVRLNNDEVMNDETQIVLTPEECMQEFSKLEEWERKYDLYFENQPGITLYYEDLIKAPQEIANEIFDFLQVKRMEVTPGTKKQTSKPIQEIISNYSELKTYFQNSRWSIFFN